MYICMVCQGIKYMHTSLVQIHELGMQINWIVFMTCRDSVHFYTSLKGRHVNAVQDSAWFVCTHAYR